MIADDFQVCLCDDYYDGAFVKNDLVLCSRSWATVLRFLEHG